MLRCLVILAFLLAGYTAPLRAQDGRLVPLHPSSGDEFGTSVAIDGTVALVGARFDDDAGSDAGAAYLFVRDDAAWVEMGPLNPGHQAGDRLGISVALDGDYAVVGATGDDEGAENAGAAYVFVRDGQEWSLQAKLTAADPDVTHLFGSAVAISGNYIIIGAPGDDDLRDDSGAVYVFFRNGTQWVPQGKLKASDAVNGDVFGNVVAMTDDMAVIGAVGDNDPSGISGSAYVFVRQGSTWTEVDKLIAADGAPENFFGNAVALSDDHIIVGMSFDDDDGENSGSAYVYKRNGTGWVQQAKLIASDAAPGDELGQAVAISDTYAIVTARNNDQAGEDAGAAYLYAFHPTTNTWGEGCQIVFSRMICKETLKFMPGQVTAGAEFGFSAAMNGNEAIIGARLDGQNGARYGSAYVYSLANPTVPSLASPADQAADLSPDVELSWQAVAGAVSYRLQVAAESSFSNLLVDTANLTVTHFQLHNLDRSATYYWRVAATNAFGMSTWSSAWHFSIASGVAVEQFDDEIPRTYRLYPNYPNPFNPSTSIQFDVPAASHVTLTVYDAAGVAVATLVDASLGAGTYMTSWTADGLASGVYLVRMRAGDVVQSREMVLLK